MGRKPRRAHGMERSSHNRAGFEPRARCSRLAPAPRGVKRQLVRHSLGDVGTRNAPLRDPDLLRRFA
jgi:hypothetical protein